MKIDKDEWKRPQSKILEMSWMKNRFLKAKIMENAAEIAGKQDQRCDIGSGTREHYFQ